jgi:hypothetical protein
MFLWGNGVIFKANEGNILDVVEQVKYVSWGLFALNFEGRLLILHLLGHTCLLYLTVP